MHRAVVLALAACGAPAAPRASIAPAATIAPATPPAIPAVHADSGEGGIEAASAGPIRLVAATPDGGAALAADDLHTVRLWPALDGSQEPRIVPLPEAHQLALGRRGDGFTAAVLDAAGGLYIATLDAQGKIRSHVSVAADPEWVGIAMATRGLVGWRADQTLVVLDGDGAPLAHLATEPGERIITVSVAGDRAAVLLEQDGKRGVRPVALEAPAWGPWKDLASTAADRVAVAPSGRFAVRDRSAVSIYDTNAKIVRSLPSLGGDSLAFVDDTHLAMAQNGRLTWLAVGDASEMASGSVNANLVAAGGRAISAANGDIVLGTPAQTRYLGYDVTSPMVAQATGNGQLAVGAMTKVFMLDDRLRVAGAPSLPVRDRAVDLRWLGDDAWAVESGLTNEDGADFRLVVHGTAQVIKKELAAPCVLGYEPSTHLLTLSLGDSPSVYRYEPAKHALVPVAQVTKASLYVQDELIPLAPARAGAQLLRVTMASETTIAWLPDAAKLDKPSAQVKLTGSFAGADATGTAYAWQSTAQGMELAVYRNGKRIGTLPADGPVSVWPDPAGGRVVEIAAHVVSLVSASGMRAWTMPIERATTALWLSAGALAIVTPSGLVRVDAATGTPTVARCGWGFGLATTPHPTPPTIEPVCAQQLERGD